MAAKLARCGGMPPTAGVWLAAPFGVLEIRATRAGVWSVSFGQAGPEAAVASDGPGVDEEARHHAEAARVQLAEYLAGERRKFELSLDLSWSSGFGRRVLEELALVRFGRTVSYAELARRAGSAGGARAAGQACGRNRLAIVIGCHRVVSSDGGLGGFSGGLTVKRWLLEHEGVPV